MSDYNLVKIGSFYFTDDGLITGRPCRIEVTGIDKLRMNAVGTVVDAADGSPHAYIFQNIGAGVPIRMLLETIDSSVLDDIIDEVNTVIDAVLAGGDDTINVTVSGETGDYDFEAMPAWPTPLEFGGVFEDTRVQGVTLNLKVVSINP